MLEKLKKQIAEKYENFKNGIVNDGIREYADIIIKAVIAVLVISVVFFLMISGNSGEEEQLDELKKIENEETVEMEEYEEAFTIVIDVGGAVETPKVVELPEGSRIDDAIYAAGGLCEDADISEVNRAQILEDGQKVYIPRQGEEEIENSSNIVSDTIAEKEKVNINTAGDDELRTLDGVGPATAEKIIRHREAEGAFKKIEDIMDVSGIGEKTFEKLKDHITV